jgi:hypothetical protein
LCLRKTFGDAKSGHALAELRRGFSSGTTSRHGPIIG